MVMVGYGCSYASEFTQEIYLGFTSESGFHSRVRDFRVGVREFEITVQPWVEMGTWGC